MVNGCEWAGSKILSAHAIEVQRCKGGPGVAVVRLRALVLVSEGVQVGGRVGKWQVAGGRVAALSPIRESRRIEIRK